ncbi:MAG: hypothetical protein KatS3mg102_1713 [Planctomycetota bacterium]|nr:MAG: hypothetical protein KatS3mg102_1713 [Planctomycetota bacterium]
MMRARDLMVTEFDTIGEDADLVEAVQKLLQRPLDTGHIDIRCLVVTDAQGEPQHLLTEADVIRAILPQVFRDPNFVDYISRWLAQDLPQQSLDEVLFHMTRAARRRKVREVVSEGRLIAVDPGDSIVKLAYLMHIERIKSLPVREDGRIVGIVFRSAVFDAIAREITSKRERVPEEGQLPEPRPAGAA